MNRSVITLFIAAILAATSLAETPLPPAREYVTVKDGQLVLDGERQRYWAVIGKVYNTPKLTPKDSSSDRETKIRDAKKGTDVLVQRFLDLGFNATRLWGVAGVDYKKGDGSTADSVDYFVFKAKERGLKIWTAGLNRVGDADPEDVGIINDPATAEAWKAAVAEAKSIPNSKGKAVDVFPLSKNLARIWDPRLEALAISRMKTLATHRNQYTGLRWCDDPVFAVWELSNEEWWMRKMVGGQWQKYPPFFKNQLIAQWNDWLGKKYSDDTRLKAAWKGLLPGEGLEKGSILFAPMAGTTASASSLNDANETARLSLEGLKQEVSRADFDPQRGSDVIEFLLEIQIAHKKREADAVKSWGRSTQLSPLVYDTGIGYEIQSQYMHQQADVVAHDAYVNGTYRKVVEPAPATATELQKMQSVLESERKATNAAPWVNWLLKPPGISQGVPWLEHNRVAGKPFFCYETQIQQPAKYRADFPLRIAALASIQDWDFICWHYFSAGDDTGTSERPFDRPMDISTGSHPQGYHFTYDEVQSAMMRSAAWIWRTQSLAPAASPTQFIFGRKSLHNPASMDYAGSYGISGMDMFLTTYQYGVRISIDPTREDDQVIGPVVKFADRATHNPFTPTPQIEFDWKKGFLAFDAPGSVAFTGLLTKVGGKVTFKNGVTLQDVKIDHPTGIFSADEAGEKYISFALHSLDGEPLAKCKAASVSLVSTSFNTGFSIGAIGTPTIAGKLPVLVARVGGTILAPALDCMSYTFRDWHMKPLGKGKISGGKLTIPAGLPIFAVELKR